MKTDCSNFPKPSVVVASTNLTSPNTTNSTTFPQNATATQQNWFYQAANTITKAVFSAANSVSSTLGRFDQKYIIAGAFVILFLILFLLALCYLCLCHMPDKKRI
jgi:hypothetical protein